MWIDVDRLVNTGRATGKKEDTQGTREEENYIYAPFHQCCHDGWEEEGMLLISFHYSYSSYVYGAFRICRV